MHLALHNRGVRPGQSERSPAVDAYATNKANLFEMSDALPGSRVLDGRWGLEHLAMALPKGRDAGLAYLRTFVEEAKSEGLVARAAARVALRGVAAE
jgi:polar amino acid transport system substrate-binding protein